MNNNSDELKMIFENIEASLYKERKVSEAVYNQYFEPFKNIDYKNFSDTEFYWTIVYVTFYSGMNAQIVLNKLENIKSVFYDYKKVLSYTDTEKEAIYNNPAIIRNKRKIKACFENAILFNELINKHKSFIDFINKFGDLNNENNLENLIEALGKFHYLGKITVYHFLTEVGLNVIKPDRVLCRIFNRLGLIENINDTKQAVQVGKLFAKATNYPIRYVDIIFVTFGQQGEKRALKIDNGICLEKNPNCIVCGVKSFCNYN
jgi:DNA-3-methyladenine glycosylase I